MNDKLVVFGVFSISISAVRACFPLQETCNCLIGVGYSVRIHSHVVRTGVSVSVRLHQHKREFAVDGKLAVHGGADLALADGAPLARKRYF